jgi:pentatricopeptide repeat protein
MVIFVGVHRSIAITILQKNSDEMATVRQLFRLLPKQQQQHPRLRFNALLCNQHRNISCNQYFPFFSSKSKHPIHRSFQFNRFEQKQLFHPNTRCLFSTTTIGTDLQSSTKYLCHETFPLGSLKKAQVAKDIVNVIRQHVRNGSPESVELAIALLTRLFQEANFEQDKTGNILIPNRMLHDVIVNAWRLCWKDKTTENRAMFEMIKALEESFPALLQTDAYPCNRYFSFFSSKSKNPIHRSFQQKHLFHPNTRCLFSTTISGTNLQSSTKYLCQETFPLGSLRAQVATDIVNVIQQQVRNGSPESVELAIALLTRLSQEVNFEKDRTGNILIPNRMLHDVVNAWRLCWKDKTTTVSPRAMFEMIKALEASFPALQTDAYPCTMIINAAVVLQDPDFAEDVLNYLLEPTVGALQPRAEVVSFNSVIDAWAKSGRKEAPAKAETVLRKLIDYSNPNVVSYNSVITAWANSNDEKAPHRAEELIREMIQCGLNPNESSYSSLLTAWARSKEDHAPDRAYAILKHMTNILKPSAYCYSAVISAYANQGNVQRAEQILMERCKHYQSTADRDLLPNLACFSSVIHAWSKSGRPESPQMAEAILQQVYELAISLDEPSLLPNAISFNPVLSAWAQSGDRDAPYRAEKILQRMQVLYEQGHADCQPDTMSFNTVLDCWAKSQMKDAPERAEAILRHMRCLYDAGNKGVKPNIISYNSVMDAWARSKYPYAALRAQALFDEILKLYQDGDQDMKPNCQSFGIIITAWGRTKSRNGASKAQSLFDDMMAFYRSGDTDLEPNVVHYNALIDAWARAGAPERADQIFRDMDTSTIAGIRPNIISYNAVMNAWSRSSKPDAVHRTQALFDELMQKYEAGDRTMKPDLHTFGTLITAWGRSKHKDSAYKAQAVFDNLLLFYRSGDHDLKPSVVICNALIYAWAKAGLPEKAEQALRELESEATLGLKPDTITYSTLMSGWSRSHHPKAIDRMQALYDEMKDKYLGGDKNVKPDARTFDTVLSSWRRTGRKDGMVKAKAVFLDIHDRYRSGEAALKPLVDKFGPLFS